MQPARQPCTERVCGVCAQGARDAAGAVDDVSEPLVVPEDIGRAAAQLLLEEVSRGGVTDGTHQGLLLLLAALGPEEMNEVGWQSSNSSSNEYVTIP